MISGYKEITITSRLGNGRRPFPCNKCERTYTRLDTLRRHLRDECGKIPQYICYICKKSFKQKSNYRRHGANVHGLYF